MLKKIAIFSLILAAFSLYAEGEYEGKLQETVVTATGFSDNIENQIKNITVITSEDIQEKGYNNVEDILKQAPGVNITQTGFGSAVDIRGQGRFGLGTSGNVSKAVSSVKVLIDGDIAMDTIDTSHAYIPLNTISVNDIERIEIINGGGTVLYGSGTRGGVVNIITKNRTKEGASGKAYYQNSSYGTNKLGFDAGINFNNKFIIDLGYENTNGKGYRKGEKESYDYLKGGLKYNITDNHSLKFKAARYNSDEDVQKKEIEKASEITIKYEPDDDKTTIAKPNKSLYSNGANGGDEAYLNELNKYNAERAYADQQINAIKYYLKAYRFSNWVRENFGNLKESDKVNDDEAKKIREKYPVVFEDFKNDNKIFSDNILESDSTFNDHKRKVIKDNIQYNLIVAAINYNMQKFGDTPEFKLPQILDTDWDKIINSVSFVVFAEGLRSK